jgi:hypothetical protein
MNWQVNVQFTEFLFSNADRWGVSHLFEMEAGSLGVKQILNLRTQFTFEAMPVSSELVQKHFFLCV